MSTFEPVSRDLSPITGKVRWTEGMLSNTLGFSIHSLGYTNTSLTVHPTPSINFPHLP